MFSKFSSILHQAAEVISPSSPIQQDFVTHWKCVTHYFIDNKEHNVAVEQTDLPRHLQAMQNILQEEEEGLEETGRTGPCIEYMLQHKMLDTLYTLARTDVPPGLKQVILRFFSKLISRQREPLLPHMNVHRPVFRMVRLCGEVKAAPSEAEEIQFLCTLCSQLKLNQYLVNFFIEGIVTDLPKSSQESTEVDKKKPDKLDFPLINSLLNLMHSPDARIGVKACEGLLLCASLTEDNSATAITKHSIFCEEMINQLVKLYLALPELMNPTDVESVEAKWGLDILSSSEDRTNFAGKRSLVSFLSWLDYLDQLVQVAHPEVANMLSSSIRKSFLEQHLKTALLQVSETKAVTATAHAIKCLHQISSPQLQTEFVYFLLGEDTRAELNHEEGNLLRNRLISRIDHLSEELSLTTLRLFECLLCIANPHIINNLVLRNLMGRNYVAIEPVEPSDRISIDKEVKNTSDSCCPSSSPGISEGSGEIPSNLADGDKNNEEGNKDSGFSEVKDEQGAGDAVPSSESNDKKNSSLSDIDPELNELINGDIEKSPTDCAEMNETPNPIQATHDSESSQKQDCDLDSTPSTTPDSVVSVNTIVNSFLNIIPEETKSSYYMADSGYDTYLRDAHRMFANVNQMCESWGWPLDAEKQESEECEFFEGSFLKAIFDKLSQMLKQTYNTNLQVTSLVSYLALYPHPHLNEFLLNPELALKPTVGRSLASVLRKIGQDVVTKQKKTPDFAKQLIACRKELMGMDNNIRRSKAVVSSTGIDDKCFMQGVIVLEEFCKELAAIAFVKHHSMV